MTLGGALRPRRGVGALAVVASVAAGSSCRSMASFDNVCTDSYAFITVVAVDTTDQPVTLLAISDSVLRTGTTFNVPQQLFPGAVGTITVFTDSYRAEVRTTGDSVRVRGAVAGKAFAALFEFGTDGCHIRKISGPDTVVVR